MDNVNVNYQPENYNRSTSYVLNHLVHTPGVDKQSPAPRTQNALTFNRYCPHCNLNFDNQIEYDHHNIEMHAYKKKLMCTYCHSVFRRQDHLKRHVQTLHLNRKYSSCPVCDKDCKRQDLMLEHIKMYHTSNTDVFRCRNCEFRCNTLADLEKHESTHASTERHICPHCNATFKRRDHMVRHVKSQHLNQSIVCPICPQVYKRRDHVVRHVREKHKMGYLNGKLVKSADVIT
ncbi:Zinc finger protein PLAGL2 [Papilio xuthus]|uniref:Zinc finger protein PLAGL2 n=1 Tax=Papilio xuthus TaxID=66420 RepID=A0A194Q4F1_PAPXU|nr:Zinc finger protein PLAGL2 [Papilio xuthus]